MIAIKYAMHQGMAANSRIVLGLILCSAALASGQNASVLPPSGVNSSSSPAGSGGSSSVDYSVSASISAASTGSAVTNVGVMATPAAVIANASAASQGSVKSLARYGLVRNQGNSSSSSNGPVSTSATGSSTSGSAKRGSVSSSKTFAAASLNAGAAKQLPQSALSVAAMKSGLTGNRLESALADTNLSPGNAANLNGAQEAKSGGGGSGGGNGAYAAAFPDSTKNTAPVSPTDLANDPLFVFAPYVSTGFPDLSDYEFLKPTLRVGGGKSSLGGQEREDLYRRIERRLKEYREAEAPKNGLKPQKRSYPSSFENPFAEKPATAEDKLNRLSDSSF